MLSRGDGATHPGEIFTLTKCIIYSCSIVLSLLLKKIYEEDNKRFLLQSFYIYLTIKLFIERGGAGGVAPLTSPPLYFSWSFCSEENHWWGENKSPRCFNHATSHLSWVSWYISSSRRFPLGVIRRLAARRSSSRSFRSAPLSQNIFTCRKKLEVKNCSNLDRNCYILDLGMNSDSTNKNSYNIDRFGTIVVTV